MNHGSLFSGIGGIDLAATWMGWRNVFQVENDEFCTKVLEKNFPGTERYGDIRTFNATKYRNHIDILSGGFPCQPFSSNGSRKGERDNRYLWPEMLRVINECKPKFVLGENVAGFINLGLDRVIIDLEGIGYECEPHVIPASSYGAPHHRRRVWILAHATSAVRKADECTEDYGWQGSAQVSTGFCDSNDPTRKWGGERPSPAESIVCGVDDGFSRKLHLARIKALGNAVVPQCAYVIFKALEQHILTSGI